MIAVDIGNSRMKAGRYQPTDRGASLPPDPAATIGLPIDSATGAFDAERWTAWCDEHAGGGSRWVAASVHRRAAERLTAAVAGRAKQVEADCVLRWLTYRDVSLPIEVEEPARVGIDRLLAAVAADRLREPGRAAVVVDLGSAITVDLLTAAGAFAGGAILPGIAMSARALAEQTDALPHVVVDDWQRSPAALGKSTTAAIESGLYWGAVGAIQELISQLSAGLAEPAEIFLTGGAAARVADLLRANLHVRHVPHLILSGIALVVEKDS